MPDAMFRQRRAEVLRTFLDRARIYLTPAYHERLEATARQNLAEAVCRLGEVS